MRGKLFLLTVAGFMALTPFAFAAVKVGEPAPSFTVTQLDGRAFDLSAARGKIVILHFWATWCAACKEEMPALDAFDRKKGQDVEILAVSADTKHHRDDVTTAMKAFHFPAAMLGDATTNGFGAPEAIPITYVIDPKGIVRVILTPDQTALTEKALENAVQPLRLP